jgi:hypothetical protein
LKLKALLDGGRFKTGAKNFHLNDKRILAVILAHSLLQFAGSHWMMDEWNSENIFFLQRPEDRTIPDIHWLYISTHFEGAQNQARKCTLCKDALENQLDTSSLQIDTLTASQHAFSRHSSIIALGILLLEMEMGRTMQPAKEDCDPKTGRPNMYTAWTTASNLLKTPEIRGSVYQDFRSVIETRLEPNKFLPAGGFEDLSFREKVYENIVAPLEDELVKGCPDLEIESFGIQIRSLLDAQNLPASLTFRHTEEPIPTTMRGEIITSMPSKPQYVKGYGLEPRMPLSDISVIPESFDMEAEMLVLTPSLVH